MLPNKYIKEGLFDKLQEGLSELRTRDVMRIAHQLGVLGQKLHTGQGTEVDIEDIECIEGSDKFARDSNYYWFWAGPELKGSPRGHMYTTVKGTILDWLVDNILFQLSYGGWDILEALEIEV